MPLEVDDPLVAGQRIFFEQRYRHRPEVLQKFDQLIAQAREGGRQVSLIEVITESVKAGLPVQHLANGATNGRKVSWFNLGI